MVSRIADTPAAGTVSRALQTFLVTILLLGQCGCGLLYKHRVETAVGTLWTNGNLQLARKYQEDLRWMKEGLQQVLPKNSEGIGSTSILLVQNDDDHIIHEDQIRTAGWYNHTFSLIQFTPTPPVEKIAPAEPTRSEGALHSSPRTRSSLHI